MLWIVFSVTAAVFFGLRAILYQRATRFPLNPNMVLLGVYVAGVVWSLILLAIEQPAWSSGAWIGVAMGVFSFTANVAMLRGFAVGKASLIALLAGLPPVVVVLVALVAWDERLTWVQWGAFGLIVLGIAVIRFTKEMRKGGLRGAWWGVLTLVTFGFHDLTGKLVTREAVPRLWALLVLFATASLLVLALEAARRTRTRALPALAALPAPWPLARTLAFGMLAGTLHFFGTFLLMHAFKTGITGLVSALVSLNVVLVIAYAGIVLRERFTRNTWLGMALALIGVIVLSAFQ
jgi:drug/metabolite transporter (DMT)-like permease